LSSDRCLPAGKFEEHVSEVRPVRPEVVQLDSMAAAALPTAAALTPVIRNLPSPVAVTVPARPVTAVVSSVTFGVRTWTTTPVPGD
jgi:hypothetical protein